MDCLSGRVKISFSRSVICACTVVAVAISLAGQVAVVAAAQEPTGSDTFKLGPGDHILINVFGEEDLSMDFQLNDTGTLNYPFLGELRIAGLSVVELEQLIASGLKGPYLVNPDVAVSIKEYRPFYLHGEVESPGGIPYQPGLTLERAIALGGGFTERASKRKITVIRAGDTEGKARPIGLNDPVRAGDVITVHQSFF
jgi:protein involved in polysaccharide export with SLBB domain